MDTRIVLLSRVNPENCIGYWLIRCTLMQHMVQLWINKALPRGFQEL